MMKGMTMNYSSKKFKS